MFLKLLVKYLQKEDLTMETKVIIDSHKQRIRKTALEGVLSGHRTISSAARMMSLSETQTRRLLKTAKEFGIEVALLDRRKGNNHSTEIPQSTKGKVVSLYEEKYSGFNFAHFTSMLNDIEHVQLSLSSVRRILNSKGISAPKKIKKRSPHRRRIPRAHAGELCQMDASKHDWFMESEDGTASKIYHHLYGLIDDATCVVPALWMEKEETTHGYFMLMKQANETTGFPLNLYVDYRGTFNVNVHKEASQTAATELTGKNDQYTTQFTRAMNDLNVDIIFASSGSAKGRIERLWKTLQNRLVNEFRLYNIKTEEQANSFFPGFLKRFNKEFSVKPADSNDFWQRKKRSDMLDIEMCPHYMLQLNSDFSVPYRGKYYVLPSVDINRKQVRDYVIKYHRTDVELIFPYDGRILMRTFDGRLFAPRIINGRKGDKTV